MGKKKPILRNMGGCLKGCVPATILSPVTISLEALMEVFIPLLMATIVDGGLYRAEEFKLKPFFSAALIADRNRFVITVGSIMILAALCSFAFGCLSARFSAVASMGFAANLRAKLLKKIQSFSFANTDRFTPASLVMRCTSDVNSMQSSFQELIRNMVRAPMMMIFAIIMSFSIDSQLAWIFVVCLPVLFVTIALIVSTGRRRFKLVLGRYDDLNARVREGLIAQREVKAFVREDFEKERFTKTNHELRIAQVNSEKIFMLSGPIQMLTMWLCTVVILYVGGSNIIFGRSSLQAGELISIVTYTGQVINALSMVSFIVLNLARTAESLKRINEVLDEETDIRDGEGDFPVADGSVRFEKVSFSYDGEREVLKEVSLYAKQGQKIAFVGSTGAGKTTVTNLINRFYDIEKGRITYDGIDVKEIRKADLRRSLGMVLQDTHLFSGSVMENIRYGRLDATDEECIEAAKIANAHYFISHLAQGYDTELIAGGTNLSQGQRQLLAIARAAVSDPPVLILDEATSSVDTRTEMLIERGMDALMRGRTVFVIAHRLSTVRNADAILVLEDGRIIERDDHQALLEQKGRYYQLYTGMFELS